MNIIERAIHRALEKLPRLKRSVVIIYQTACAVVPYRELIPEATGHECHFFGFHDKCPWHRSGSLALSHRFTGSPHPGHDCIEVGVLEPHVHGSFSALGKTVAWNWQQGSELQWLGESDLIIYNTTQEGQAASIVCDMSGACKNIYPPVAAVSPDGSSAVSFDFDRLALGMPGYGYPFSRQASKQRSTLTYFDFDTGTESELYSFTNRRSEFVFLSHASFSVTGRRLAFFERISRGSGALRTAMKVVHLRSGNIINLPLFDASHYAWIDDKNVIAFCRLSPKTGWSYYIVDVSKGVVTKVPLLTNMPDGHPGTCGSHDLIVSDTYPDRQRLQRLMVVNLKAGAVYEIARLKIPARFRGVNRCDFHPRWSRDGAAICFDSAHTGMRTQYFMEYPPTYEN